MMPPAARRHTRPAHRAAGFTLVELVLVITIVGALAVFALPRALDLSMWRLRAYADELQAQSMAMQRLALAQRRPVVGTITPAGVAFGYQGGAAIVSIDCPATDTPCIGEAGARSVTFNAGNSGRALTSTGSALPVTLGSGGTALAYRIEPETGLFRTAP